MNLKLSLDELYNKENEVKLEEVLYAREIRVDRQNEMLSKINNGCLICFTMNIAGPYKISGAIQKAFEEGLEKINQMLKWNDIEIKHSLKIEEKTGYEAFIAVEENPTKVKNLLMQIEEGISLGRLFDIDILDMNGEKISRTDSGNAERSCLVCGKDGRVCASRRLHPVEEIQYRTIKLICDYFNNNYADEVAENAVKSLLYEASTTPKPGLVDMDNNGSHKDMDFFTFLDSSASLVSYFRDCALAGINNSSYKPEDLFKSIRYRGRLAESNMNRATNNINTHKGAIFSLGIICSAIGYLYANEKDISINTILNLCSEMAKLSLNDFDNIDKKHLHTFGESLYAEKKLSGIRGEAANGYPSVYNIGYPTLIRCINEGLSINDAGAIALISMLSEVEDTNIIKRSNIDTLKEVQKKAKELIKNDSKYILKSLKNLNDEFVKLNISPGGCADMLAICYMIYFTVK